VTVVAEAIAKLLPGHDRGGESFLQIHPESSRIVQSGEPLAVTASADMDCLRASKREILIPKEKDIWNTSSGSCFGSSKME
jgi:hypothetical protein